MTTQTHALSIRHTQFQRRRHSRKERSRPAFLHYFRRSASSRGNASGWPVSFGLDRLGPGRMADWHALRKIRDFYAGPVRSKSAAARNLISYAPRIFAGVDIYNDGESDATITYSFAGKSRSVLHHQAQRASPIKDRSGATSVRVCRSISQMDNRCGLITWPICTHKKLALVPKHEDA